MNQQMIALSAEIADLRAQLDAIQSADWYDAEAYERVAERLVTLEAQHEELLAGLLQERWTARFKTPMSRERALELARVTLEQRYAKEVAA